MKDFGHLNYGINPKVPAERKIEWVNSLDGHGNESVTESTYKSYSTKAQNKRFEVQTMNHLVVLLIIWTIVDQLFLKPNSLWGRVSRL